MKKIALLDFCQTIVDFETFDRFIIYVLDAKGHKNVCKLVSTKIVKRWLYIVQRLLACFGYDRQLYKTLLVRMLKGITRDELTKIGKRYYEEEITPRLIDKTHEIIRGISGQYEIIIVSGGCDLYIEYYAKGHNIKHIVTTELEFNESGICTGRIKGSDCIGQNKILKLREYIKGNLKEYMSDYKWGLVITDSISDAQLVQMCEDAIIISREKHQPWIENYENIKEIVWI